MNMKLKLTFKYVSSIVVVAILVVIFNLIILFFLMSSSEVKDANKYQNNYNVQDYVRDFGQYIEINENKTLYLNDKGKESLDNSSLWIQVLDENAMEVYSYNKPEDIKDKHTPIELINGYKYAGGFGGYSQILAGSKELGNNNYTYLVGFPMGSIQKFVFIIESDTMINWMKNTIIAVIIIDFIIAVIFGYIFSKGLTKPVKKIISGVEDLSSGIYTMFYKEKGVYGKVFNKLNALSDKLNSNEIERERMEKMKVDWIANISHDIKTPLSSIKGYAEVLGDDYDFSDDDVKEYAHIINNKADYIKELVNDLNLTMKLKNNKSIINREEVNIVNLLKNAVIDIFNDPKYSEIDIEFKENKSIIMKSIDETLMKRAINNLIYNALVHNDKDVKICISIFEKEKTHIIISDNGRGIKEDELKYIFERYYRGTNTGEVHKGSGLGMAIVKEIVNAHDGDIKISSKIDKGTDIEIII